MIGYLRGLHGHVSAERALSGAGPGASWTRPANVVPVGDGDVTQMLIDGGMADLKRIHLLLQAVHLKLEILAFDPELVHFRTDRGQRHRQDDHEAPHPQERKRDVTPHEKKSLALLRIPYADGLPFRLSDVRVS